MKKSFKILVSMLATAVCLSSCLKDKSLFDPDKVDNVVEFANLGAIESSTTSPYPLFSKSFEVVPEAQLEVYVNYAGDEAAAPEDITVQLAVKSDALTTYNTANKTSYTLLPTSLYSVPTSVVIPKGSRNAKVVITFKPNQFDLSKTYGLPLAITSATKGNISGNFGTVVYRVGAKNKYDGVYEIKADNATFQDVQIGAAATKAYPKTVHLVTVGANSVAYFDPNLNSGTYGYRFLNNGSGTYYGNFAPVFEMDPTTLSVKAVTNHAPYIGNTQGRDAKLDPTGVNKFTFNGNTPSTLQVSYILTQNGANKALITEKLEYKGPRP
ncbi:DUF1735 domain-containing protein [Flavisolibacter tropicus]|uniref:BT-3987-like N-terminal domain-containing protein n=1 Tax=Flavisolibacter tropicus TaxID=1492898 RepID=A0A172U0S9_9BACT|nr:DUF1735 domain-containing protein [Flavisolibacter tropicus]ANE52633.1 hypothetical protein SY85_21265 [Flavisolibacter tropicus]